MSKGDEAEIDALFQLSPPEFVAARNALAAQLKKTGRDDMAGRVRSLPKPSISAWTVNQLYWKHRPAFEKLLATGERFRQAQASRLAGRNADIHRLLNERREELSAMARLAAGILQRSSGAAPPGVMRRITASLEALSAYGTLEGAPRAGRLVEDVDPPGFDALAALVPRVGDGARASVPSKVLAFQKEPKTLKGRKLSADDAQAKEKERQARLTAARTAKREASSALVAARRAALQAETALKKAATRAKETEATMVAAEERLQKVAALAHEARQRARRAAVDAESAAQAVEEGERTLERAARELSSLESERS